VDTTGGARRDRLAIMNLNSRISVRRLKVIGLALLCDAAVFIGTLLLMMTGMLGDEPWLYYPIVFVCIVPLGIGWILSAVHLATTAGLTPTKLSGGGVYYLRDRLRQDGTCHNSVRAEPLVVGGACA